MTFFELGDPSSLSSWWFLSQLMSSITGKQTLSLAEGAAPGQITHCDGPRG